MVKKLPISVFIIAQDEADRISYAINSVKGWVDEILVIDSGSKDGTQEVAKKLGAKVIFNKWQGYGQQKIFGEKQCKNNWILNIDADEEITDELKQEIFAAHNKGFAKDAYRLRIKLMFMHQKKPSLLAHINDPARLYDKTKAGFKNSTVHDAVVLNDGTLDPQRVGKFAGIANHRSFRSFSHMLDKVNSYSTMQAEDRIKNKRPSKLITALRIIFEPPFAFLKNLIIRRYFVYGLTGIVVSYIYAYGRFARQAKTMDLLLKNES